jgi:5-methylcytosine-specific restriction endonuclease McrA
VDIPYSTLPPRKTRVRKVSNKERVKRAKRPYLRREVFDRDKGDCQLGIANDCWGATTYEGGHMHHVRHRSLGGEDKLSNLVWACPPCHWLEHNPKACPKKPSDSTRIEG